MITFESKGSFGKTETFMRKVLSYNFMQRMNKYGEMGVAALSSATPVESGTTARSWGYKVVPKKNSIAIVWTNSNVVSGVPIAIILQYGHGTGTGGFVQGIDYINPAMKPVFDKISQDFWREVSSL